MSTENIAVLKSVGAFIPGSDRFLDIDVLLPLAEQYKSNVDDLKVEVQQIQRMIQRKDVLNVLS